MSKRAVQSITLALLIGFAAQTSFAAPDEYDDSQSHPLRVLAYAWHPVGWGVWQWRVWPHKRMEIR